jgi:Tfp pilus assembly protein PilZ
MVERRRYKRIILVLTLRYTKILGFVKITSLTVINDIGLGGLCIALSRTIAKGDELLLELRSPYNSQEIAALAKVAWVRPYADNGHNICGLKFIWLSSKSFLLDCMNRAKKIETPA